MYERDESCDRETDEVQGMHEYIGGDGLHSIRAGPVWGRGGVRGGDDGHDCEIAIITKKESHGLHDGAEGGVGASSMDIRRRGDEAGHAQRGPIDSA